MVITQFYHYEWDGEVLEITSMKEGRYCYFKPLCGKPLFETPNFDINDIKRKATQEEINNALLEKAKRDYPIGTRFKSVASRNVYVTKSNDPLWWCGMIYFNDGGGALYSKGKWAEIVKQPDIEINGYKAEFFDKHVMFGCARIDMKVFLVLNASMSELNCTNKESKQIESITIGKGTFTKEQIKEISEYYLNKNK